MQRFCRRNEGLLWRTVLRSNPEDPRALFSGSSTMKTLLQVSYELLQVLTSLK